MISFERPMNTNRFGWAVAIVCFALFASKARTEIDDPLFHSINPLAPRDDWGRLHQMKNVDETDYFPRWGSRVYYYFKSGRELLRDPAYVAALQTVMRNRGYYCGPIDGVMSDAVSDGIARVQRNHLQSVTGHLTIPVRRALFLP